MSLPTPHGDKLNALLENEKLPTCDRERIKQAIDRYQAWRDALTHVPVGDDGVDEAVRLLNEYRLFLDIDVIFDSDDEKPGLRCFPASVFPEKAKGIYDHTTPLSGGVHLE